MSPLMPFVAHLDLILFRGIADDLVQCPIVAYHLADLLWPDWLPLEARAHGENGYGRHMLYEDPAGRFSIGSFTWLPGEATPIHDHHCWGVMGVAQGRLISENFEASASGNGGLQHVTSVILPARQTAWLSPNTGDIHRLVNPSSQTTISIHVYGAAFSAVCRTRYEHAADTQVIPRSPDATHFLAR